MIHPTALIGEPPEHREHRHRSAPDAHTTMWFQPLIDETATIEALVTVDSGVFRHTWVGARTWLMKKVHVGHDAIIGDDCEIAPLTSIGGEVIIGDGVKIGQGATLKPRVEVQDGAVIGMGAVVTKSVPAGETWVGNPARKLEERPARAPGGVFVHGREAFVGIEAFDPQNAT
jgi:UDP-N-acetylglucosamine acyltransferase